MDATAFDPHDHAGCISDAMAAAERRCRAEGLQLTPVRRRALEILLREHRAMGAYEVLEKLAADGFGAQPPVAYRALDFLVGHGLAHRLERLNAYAACTVPDHDHVPAFLICRSCRAVAETETVPGHGGLGRSAKRAGFAIERLMFEAEGLCPACAEGEA